MIDVVATALGFGSGLGAKALARLVPGKGACVAALSEPVARALEQAGHAPRRVALEGGRLALDDAGCDALCASGLPPVEVGATVLTECARVVKDGGRVHLATPAGLTRRGPERQQLCALFLHAGLMDIEQRLQRGVVVTSGRVRR